MDVKNLLTNYPDASQQECLEGLIKDRTIRIERIVSKGQASPPDFWYDQEEEEWVLLLRGSAGLRFHTSPKIITMKAGDSLHIPAHMKHRVEWTEENKETVWVAVYWKGSEA